MTPKHDPNPTLMMGDEMRRAMKFNEFLDSIGRPSGQPALVNSKPAAFRPAGFDQAQGE